MKISRSLISILLAIVMISSELSRASVPWNVDKLKTVPETYSVLDIVEPGVKSILFAGPEYQGKPTRVFAFIGIPDVVAGQRVPGIVLLHGGGGTAFADWVRLWKSRGYAAIAFDHSGGLPIGSNAAWKPNPDGGPHIGDWAGPPEDSWMYHVVADGMLATSLMRSYPQVDPNRIGLTGVSWGGVAACAIAGIDDRLKFVIPVYGCGFIDYRSSDEPAPMLPNIWDPSHYLPAAKAPMLWLNGSNDHFFTINSVQKSYRIAPVPHTLCTRIRMYHGQDGLASGAPEILTFAESIVNQGVPLARVLKQGVEGRQAWVSYESSRSIIRAELNFTREVGLWEKRNFVTVPATVDATAKRVSGEVAAGSTGYYFNLIDDRNLIVSSEYVALGQPDGTTNK
jgi:dienelactone hydrolase